MSEPRLTPAQRHRLKFQKQVEATPTSNPAAPQTPLPSKAPALSPHASIDARRLSPAQRSRARVLAALTIATAGVVAGVTAAPRPEAGPEATAYQLLLARLGQDLSALRNIHSVEKKIEAKRQMIGEYDAHVLGVLEAVAETGKAVQDEVFVTLMIWRLDIGDFDLALDMADVVIKHGLALPERYDRNADTLIAEEIAEAALTTAKMPADFSILVLQRAIALSESGNINDIVRAKLQKALGKHLVRAAEAIDLAPETGPAGGARAARQAALTAFRRAFELFDKSGVVKDIEGLERALKKEEPANPGLTPRPTASGGR